MRSVKRLGKYACLELERRYLIRRLPPNIDKSGWFICDRYISGTRLRLRRMTSLEDGDVLCKFGQKFRASGQNAAETTMTNIYLNEVEYERLAQLDADVLVKNRYHYAFNDLLYSIDVFEGNLKGLILAEIECETMADYKWLRLPPFALVEVTKEPFFRGGNLVTLGRKEFQITLASWFSENSEVTP